MMALNWPAPWASFFEWLLRTSWQAAILVCLIAAMQLLFRRRLSPRWRCHLWLLVVIKLALPLPPKSQLSLFNVFRTGGRQPAAARLGLLPILPQIAEPPPTAARAVAPPNVMPLSTVSGDANFTRSGSWAELLASLWAAGVLAMVGRILFEQRRLCWQLGGAVQVRDPGTLRLLEDVRRQMKVRTQVQLFETTGIRSPALYGFIRPRLLLPAGLLARFSSQELGFIFAHEFAHVKRGDIAWNWLLGLLQVVHWFNPFVWFAFARLRADRELACDAEVLNLAATTERQQYGATVIKLLEQFDPTASVLPALVGIFESRHEMKARIRMIAGFKRTRRWSLLAAVLIAGAGVLGLTEAQPRQRAEQPGTKPSSRSDAANPDHGQDRPGAQYDLLFLVVDAIDNRPLSGSALKISCCNTQECFLLGRFTTPLTGPVSIRYPANANSIAVHVSKDGYVPKLVTWRPGRNDRIDGPYVAKLEHGVTIGGKVSDQDGRPVADAEIFLNGPGIEDPIAREHSGLQGDVPVATTDENGFWLTTSAPPDLSFSLSVRHARFAEAGLSLQDGENSDPPTRVTKKNLRARSAVLTLSRGQVVEGEVLDGLGKPIAQANVLLGEKFTRQPRLVRTDATGRFRFEHEAHQRTVTVQADGYAPDLKFLDETKETQHLSFQLAPGGVIKGRVVDEESRPLSDVTVTVGTAHWRGQQTLSWDGKTDAAGRFTWVSAPTDGIIVGFLKPGYMISEVFFASGVGEKTVVLQRERRFAGLVLDADTSEPVTQFRITPGESIEVGGAQHMVNWQPYLAVAGRDGQFEIKPERAMQIISIEAEGYLPITAPIASTSLGGTTTNTFRLKRGSGLSGVVQLPDGTPAAHAQVAVKSKGTFLELGHGMFNRLGGPQESKIVEADLDGRFVLPPKAEVTAFVAIHEKGYGEIQLGGELTSTRMELKKPWVLQAWGTVEGVLRVNQRPASNQAVALASDPSDADAVQLGFEQYQTRTDTNGFFVITNAPPGKRMVCRLIPQGKHAWTFAYAIPVTVEPGQTVSVRMASAGVQIIGRAVSKDHQPVDWQSGRSSLHTVRPRPPASLKSQEEFLQWSQSPEVKASLSNYRSYPVVFADDGSFQVDDVPAGAYELDLTLGEGGGPGAFGGRVLGECKRELVVPELQGKGPAQAIDLGVLQLVAPAPRDRAQNSEQR